MTTGRISAPQLRRRRSDRFRYSAHGLVLSVPFRCPELTPASATADVTIRYGQVPDRLEPSQDESPVYQARPDRLLFDCGSVARFLVRDGKDIVIDRGPRAVEEEIRIFLLGTCLGAVLHQRGLLVLHASAIATERGAVLFAGACGAGKSTLLAAFLQRGHRMLSDDVTVIRPGPGVPMVLPGYPQAKLWADAMASLAIPTAGLQGLPRQPGKFAVPHPDRFAEETVPLFALFHLLPHERPEIRLEPVAGIDKFHVLLANTYRECLLDGLGLREAHFGLVATASRHLRARQVFRPQQPGRLSELIETIAQDLHQA